MSPASSSSDSGLDLRTALTALAALLPALLIALPAPLSWLEGDPWPQYSMAALALVGSTAMLIMLAARRPERVPRGAMTVLLPLALATFWDVLGAPSDRLEFTRALAVLLAGSASFLVVALLPARGLRVYLRGLCVISVLLLLSALADPAGVLGNSGSLSHMALGGAGIGLWLLLEGSKPERVLGGAALGLFLAHAARAPVLAGSLALLTGIGTAWLLMPRWRKTWTLPIAALLTLAALLTPLLRISDATLPASSEQRAPAVVSAGNTGGIGVRLSIWKASLPLIGDHPLTGVGPGQFAATFPPYRSVEEIERSSLGRTLAAETEVDHPHNDWIARLSELGLIGAACLLVLVMQALWTLQRERERTAPLIVASVALIANSCVHGVLSHDAGSSVIAMGLLGAVLSHPATPARARSLRVASCLLLGITSLELPRALAVLRHGSALSSLGRDQDATTLLRASERALEACPDSVHARALRAQVLADEAAWQAVLEQRPERFEAWMQTGNLRARAHDAGGAQQAFEHALRLDPWHPGLLENQLTLLSRTGTLTATQSALARLRARKSVRPEWLLDRARRAWLHGNEDCARWLYEEAALEPWPSGPDEAYGLFRARKQAEDAPAAEFFESVAQRGFARRNAEQGHYKEALRNYRQDLQLTGSAIPGGAPRVRWEFAACLLAQGERDKAQVALLGLAPVSGLPDWAIRALESRP